MGPSVQTRQEPSESTRSVVLSLSSISSCTRSERVVPGTGVWSQPADAIPAVAKDGAERVVAPHDQAGDVVGSGIRDVSH